MPRTLRTIQDEMLVIRSQDGEPDALRELIARWERRLHAHAWALTRDAEAASDVTQEAWLAIARGIRRLSDPALFGSWAYRIVTHKCADWTRAQQRRRALERGVAREAAVRSVAADGPDHAVTRLREALAAIDPERRAILSMRYLAEMSVNRIAAALDIPAGTVKSRLHHAREELKRALERKMS